MKIRVGSVKQRSQKPSDYQEFRATLEERTMDNDKLTPLKIFTHTKVEL
jgi:hypothetical protein